MVEGDCETIHDGTTEDDLSPQASDPGLDRPWEAGDSNDSTEFRSLHARAVRKSPTADKIRRAELR